MSYKILSFDPGGTTGWACMNFDEFNVPIGPDAAKIVGAVGEVTDLLELETIIDQHKPDAIVYEEFKLYPWKAKHKFWSTFPEVEVIGALKYIAIKRNIPFFAQGANTKKFWDDKKLKQCNVWEGLSPHERDAIRHGFYAIDFSDDLKKQLCKGGE